MNKIFKIILSLKMPLNYASNFHEIFADVTIDFQEAYNFFSQPNMKLELCN